MKKKVILILTIIFVILIAGVILPKPIDNLDELWNFNFARNIANNLIPYRDFNMVQTPLLSILAGLVLKLFGTELFVMRILAILLSSLILLTVYLILKECKINKYVIFFALIGFFMLYKDFLCFDYNFGVLLIILFTIYIEIKNLDKLDFKNDFLLGILVGTSILIKQTTGLAFSLVYMFYRILNIYDKSKWKNELKRIAFRAMGALVPIIIFSIYLTINHIWYEFIDYTILGIKTFSNKILYINLLNGNYGIIIQILSVVMPITLLYLYFKTVVMKTNTNEDNILFILFAYSVASIVVIYPISDDMHFLVGILPLRDSVNLYSIYTTYKNAR